jgi:hypothetical protein
MTTTTTANQGRHAATATEQVRVRRVVLHHARDDNDAAELLAMLGLVDDQQDSTTPRRGGLTGRQPGEVRALSGATEARLASNGSSANKAPAVAPAGVPAVAESTAQPSTAVDRRCAGCGAPVVPQTRYRLDPAGYRQRGIKLLAAKERCHACYYQLRHPAAAEVVEPKNPRHCEKCKRPMVSEREFRANPDGWRKRGWMAHAAHGVCRNCRAAADRRRGGAGQRAPRRVPALCDLVDQLAALRQQVRYLRASHPDDVPLACMATALGEARRHLEAASVRIAEQPADAPNQGGDR